MTLASRASDSSRRQVAEEAIPALIRTLEDEDEGARRWAARTLGIIHGEPETTLPALVAVLGDSEPCVRAWTAEALGRYGEIATSQVPALLDAFKDEAGLVRSAAATALGLIGSQPELVVPALATGLRDADTGVAEAATDALICFGAEARMLIPALVDLLQDETSYYYRCCAARILGSIGHGALPAADKLKEALNDKHKAVRLEAAGSLAQIGTYLTLALPVAERLLLDLQPDLRLGAARILANFGVAAQPAIPALVAALDDNELVREQAARSLVVIANALRDARVADSVAALKAAKAAMGSSQDQEVKVAGFDISQAISALEAIKTLEDHQALEEIEVSLTPVASGGAAGAVSTGADMRRIALVIGNAAYQNVGPLSNTVRDAQLMANTLTQLDFKLAGGGPLVDLDRRGFIEALTTFGDCLQDSYGAVGLFYYAGHGIQVNGINYLVPVDAKPRKPSDADTQLVDASFVIRQMEDAQALLKVVILDACRNNPFRGVGSVRGLIDRGLAVMQAPEGTLIAYATQPGNVAADGELGRNGPYAQALAQALVMPGIDVLLLFNDVGLRVSRATHGQQQPWMTSSPIQGRFYFSGRK